MLALAVVAALLAGIYALAEEAPALTPALGDPATPPGAPVPLARAIHLSRFALLIVAGTCAGIAVAWWERPPASGAAVLAAAALFTYLVGDALPRALGVLAPGVATRALVVARRLLTVFRPLIGLIGGVDRIADRLMPSRRSRAGVLGPAQQEMLVGVLSLGETTVADIMTPRLDIAALEAGHGWSEIVDQVRSTGHSRTPVYRNSLDEIIGILYAKDLAPATTGATEPVEAWHELIRPAEFVPEKKLLADQLHAFQRGHAHLAIVVDEFGGTSGLITLEDILEEIVGEIHDEYDRDEQPLIQQEGDGKFWVAGRLPIDDLAALLDTPIEHEDVSTVGGLIFTELGHVPQPGEELAFGGFRVVVERVVRRRVERVYFERLGSESDAARPAGAGTDR